MPDYRVYTLDAFGRIAAAVEKEYGSDSEALAFAIDMIEPNSRGEVWQKARYIGDILGISKRGST